MRLEIIQTVKGIFTGTFCPAVSVFLASNKIGNAYCGVNEQYGWGYLVASFFVCWIAADFWEFYYHHLGHKFTFMCESLATRLSDLFLPLGPFAKQQPFVTLWARPHSFPSPCLPPGAMCGRV